MSLGGYFVLALSSLFVIVDPIAAVPAFIAMTARDDVCSRLRMARLASMVAAGVLALFVLCGKWLFSLLGITLPAFQVTESSLLRALGAWRVASFFERSRL